MPSSVQRCPVSGYVKPKLARRVYAMVQLEPGPIGMVAQVETSRKLSPKGHNILYLLSNERRFI
eukprot:6195413-Pleurochrysis_carterae.AAC.6